MLSVLTSERLPFHYIDACDVQCYFESVNKAAVNVTCGSQDLLLSGNSFAYFPIIIRVFSFPATSGFKAFKEP